MTMVVASVLAFSPTPASAASGSSLTQTWGSATVSATSEWRPGFMQGYDVSMKVKVTDHLKNDKCVYVEYRIITPYGRDADATIATACNRLSVERNKTVVVGNNKFGPKGSPGGVEFKMCHAVWGVDPCVKSKVSF
ncbi:hypothetical protein QLQ12_44350 [Actinoplanes sp. NEAU-A12]|uniref:Uncharacterized protein n=1 Tax=Actinoplanes sandaracinus TaxID=3045177 RepID=A0ABT6X1B9_9ACTN|nr:hypothetical protein [Actinoplanes sandaracinus]MDI6105635.1 hypothetical protein [Actinoplanes sandaracinus]